jgi:hypothetical protein
VILSLQFNGFVDLGNTVPVCSFLLSHKLIVFRLILKISLTSPFFRPSISIAVMTFCLKSSLYGFAIPVAIHFFYSTLCPNSFGYCYKCPFCGFGQASTLDHYLPKAKYPQFSVLPFNLVPSCKDCNTGKSTAIATTAEGQCLHPYFDHQNFIKDQWLYAKVRETEPATIYFFVKAPEQWDNISKAKVQAHFSNFKLDSRYSVEAGNEMVSLRDVLVNYCQSLGSEWVRQHLKMEANSSASQHSNSWKTAMFQALVASDWYCDGGFR